MQRPFLFRIEPASTTADVRNRYSQALAAGFDGVELTLESANDTAGIDVKIGTVAARCTTRDVPAALCEVSTMLTQAGGLNAQALNLTIPPLGRSNEDYGFGSYQEALNFAYELLHHLRFEAEATGVALALEAGVDGCLLSPVELREIIDAANSWAVGACIDVGCIARIGSPRDWLTTLGARIHTVRVGHDARGGKAPSPTPSDRVIDVPSIVETLDAIRYDRIVIAAGDDDPGWLHERLKALCASDHEPARKML